jgi:23S rRNA pseudouridine2457 synthase
MLAHLSPKNDHSSFATMRYLIFFKPYGVLSDFTDPAGRPTLADYILTPGVEPAGRLDADSEGLMFLTDDGRLAHALADPRFKLPKTYFVQIENIPDAPALNKLRRGVLVKGEMTASAEVELLPAGPDLPPRAVPVRDNSAVPTAWLKIILREGKKRQIRHMTAAVGYPTLRIVRVAIGPLTLRGLAPGQWRDLTDKELRAVRRDAGWG